MASEYIYSVIYISKGLKEQIQTTVKNVYLRTVNKNGEIASNLIC